MTVGPRDGLRLVGISIVCFCAVFVCTFFLNYYIDVQRVDGIPEAVMPLYDAQLATARFTCAITGGFLGVIAAVMLVFYIKLYIDRNSTKIGILKALGYSDGRIARGFWVFGLSVLVGTTAGFGIAFACMPAIYKTLTIDGMPPVDIEFNAALPFALVVAPTLVFSAIACGFAYFAVRRPVAELLRREPKASRPKRESITGKDRPFISEMRLRTLGAKKSIAFFFAFSCFCFSAMVQMGLSMEKLDSGTMGMMILAIGLTLAAVTMVMSVTTLVNDNIKNISVMKAFGYSTWEYFAAVLSGYIPFAFIGFAVGTAYQYGLLRIMMDLIFDGVAGMPEYSFDVSLMFITLAAFVVTYAAVMAVYVMRMSRISVKEIMTEN